MKHKIAISILAFTGFPAWAITAPVIADTCVKSSAPDSSFGNAALLEVSQQSTALLRFNLDGLLQKLQSSSQVSATVRIYVNRLITPGAIEVDEAGSPWDEVSITGRTPVPPGLPVGTANVNTAQAYVTIDATPYIRVLQENSAFTDWGLVIRAVGGTSLFFDSKESVTTSHPAVLDITALPPPGKQGPTGPAGTPGIAGPHGPAGPTGDIAPSSFVSQTFSIPWNQISSRGAVCPSDKPYVVQGGCSTPRNDGAYYFRLMASAPVTDSLPQGWFCTAYNAIKNNLLDLTVTLKCSQ